MKSLLTLLFLIPLLSTAQPDEGKPDLSMEKTIDAMQLTPSEVPARYKESEEMLYISEEPYRFYNQCSSFVGRLSIGTYQAYQSGNEKGTIYYFAFPENFKKEEFLKEYFWKGKTATPEHPEEFYIKGKILVIWSLPADSEIKKISKEKVMRVLGKN